MRKAILRNIFRSFYCALVVSIIGIIIAYSSERKSLEGEQAVTLLLIASAVVLVALAAASLAALFASSEFVRTEKSLFVIVYFAPVLFVVFVVCTLTFRLSVLFDKMEIVSLLPAGSYLFFWTIYFFQIKNKQEKENSL